MTNPANTARLPLAVPTAMHDDASLDRDGQAALAAAVADAGADAVSVLALGSGEPGELDDDERVAVLTASRQGAGGIPVLAGVGPPGPAQLATARRLADAGADLLVVPLGGAGEHRLELLGRIASLALPVVVHHHPGVTGVAVPSQDLIDLVRHIEATAVLSEVAPVPDAVAALVAADVTVFGGLGGLFLPEELDAGAHGTAAASAVPEHLAEVARRHRTGERGAAREQLLVAAGYLRLEAGSTGTVVRKEAWRQRGLLRSGRVRRGAPLGPTTKAVLTQRLGELGVELAAPWPGA
ncbi:dihydrodipicolinate synthase family protein [Nitriliruptor alkaliphilus]|uniref:dihydrodipicolinate synthase family protein n=1 Tax=Nitriliruptor alkaliphilus TaxID=427918 RepID=UPI0012ED58BA|nr:dihydrodipicolinate synthase family protein [Nitriliruptor alkaliphilus]